VVPKKINSSAGIHLWAGFSGVTLEEELKFLISEYHIGGIVLFRRNVEGPEQLGALLREAQSFARETMGRGLLVSIDQEGGPVQRLAPPHFPSLPSARDLARLGPEAVSDAAGGAARELRRIGIQVNLAPVLDVVGNQADHFMEARSLGSDPERVGRLGKLWIEAMQREGVSATAKHFPGLGHAQLDPHHFAPVIRWETPEALTGDMLPFRDAVRAGAHCVMTSHALYPDLDPKWPATLSPAVNRKWLRERLGFDGILLSDDMDMAAISANYGWDAAVRQGLLASIDSFLLCQRGENLEPFFRELSEAPRRLPELAAAMAESRQRLERLLLRHDLLSLR
jgi:beta-N-acetylhexosaminidase